MNIKQLSTISGVLLLVAILPLPYGFYTFLRIAITLSSSYIAYHFHQKDNFDRTFVFAAIAILFNPIIPVYLTKELWAIIDLSTALLFFFNANSKLKVNK